MLVEKFDVDTLIWLLIAAAAFGFFVYETIHFGGAISLPLNL
jgi:hypothetical protein